LPALQHSSQPILLAIVVEDFRAAVASLQRVVELGAKRGERMPWMRKVSHGDLSANGAICRARLLTVTTTLRQQGRDVWQFLEQAWIAHHHGGIMPSLLPDA
jgi:hypothetical protein